MKCITTRVLATFLSVILVSSQAYAMSRLTGQDQTIPHTNQSNNVTQSAVIDQANTINELSNGRRPPKSGLPRAIEDFIDAPDFRVYISTNDQCRYGVCPSLYVYTLNNTLVTGATYEYYILDLETGEITDGGRYGYESTATIGSPEWYGFLDAMLTYATETLEIAENRKDKKHLRQTIKFLNALKKYVDSL